MPGTGHPGGRQLLSKTNPLVRPCDYDEASLKQGDSCVFNPRIAGKGISVRMAGLLLSGRKMKKNPPI